MHRKEPGELPGAFLTDTMPDPNGITVGGEIVTTTGQRLPLEQRSGFSAIGRQWECLRALGFRDGMAAAALSFRASEPLFVDEVAWHLTIR